jgi:C-terminal processing protease CtpA/Prc
LKKVQITKFYYSIKFIWYSLGSAADKAGLYIDDEVISMNDENIENMTFDQVRKILKERNLRGSIKLVVRTYEGNIKVRT